MHPATSTRILALFLSLLMALPAWPAKSTATPELPDPGRPGMSRDKQEQLGLKTAAEVYKVMPVLPDSDPVAQYVKQLGGKLLGVVPRQESWPYQFHVVQQSDINAFALPGGPIFVNIGTINAADNEAELAGVLAHEMSHVYMQHSAKQAPKREWANVLGALGGLLGGSAGDLAKMGIQFGAGTLLMRYSRHDEAEADQVGAVMMYKAGYNPRAMAEFFAKLEKAMGNGGPQFLSDHPNPGNRVEAVDREVADWPPKQYMAANPAFQQIKQQAKGIKAYNAQQISDGAKSGLWAQQNRQSGAVPRELQAADDGAPVLANSGAISNVSYQQVQPSGEFKTFQGNDFSMNYPANWQAAAGQNSATIAPSAAIGQNAIAYGVVVATARNVDAGSLNDATQALIQNLQETNPGLRVYESPRKIAVAGTEGLATLLSGNSPVREGDQSLPERDWLITLSRPEGGMLHMVFIAPERQFPQLQPTYQKMLESLQLR
ncbi:MAG TPA: M48 family metallopeptidase [Candidatus Sulfotelmatobacter sp.]|nr:M48 family metallopeptidase [Candidatus Sulfotelmatobacter sp.]